MNEEEKFNEFIQLLKSQALRKAKAYDGSNRILPVDVTLRFAIEELGEISTAITRDRYLQAWYECLDLAHCAFLIWIALAGGEIPHPQTDHIEWESR